MAAGHVSENALYPYHNFRRRAANVCYIYNYSESNIRGLVAFQVEEQSVRGIRFVGNFARSPPV